MLMGGLFGFEKVSSFSLPSSLLSLYTTEDVVVERLAVVNFVGKAGSTVSY